MRDLFRLCEPTLLFRHGQEMEDPRDGLRLFGPFDSGRIYGIRWGIAGTPDCIKRFLVWANRIQYPISSRIDEAEKLFRPHYPGFDAAFGIPFSPTPSLQVEIPAEELDKCIRLDNRHHRVYAAVDLYAKGIIDTIEEEETRPDLWFVVIPDNVYRYCRPQSIVEKSARIESTLKLSATFGKRLEREPSFFEPLNVAAKPYQYEPNFHNQLKARLLGYLVPTQVLRESTIAPLDFLNPFGRPKRRVDEPSTVAWNISNAVFYKAGARPWKLANVREGVCYLGLVFKQDDRSPDARMACCAAQMFLDSGDGVVFKGAVGPWYSAEDRNFHLSSAAAKELVQLALETYRKMNPERIGPRELFIHGKISFDDAEWQGFSEAAGGHTKVVGVRIRRAGTLKLYSKGTYPVLRGVGYALRPTVAYLWTVGFTPRLQTYIGKELPNPLSIDVCRGEASLEVVCRDVLALTKLNYNSCIFSDGQPVTLRFADSVGEILTAGPLSGTPPLPFKYYI